LMLLNGTGGVKSPQAEVKPRIPPSQWPGDTHLERLRWFAANCTPEPDMMHIREWAVSLLSRATPEAAEASFLTQPTQSVDWASELKRLTLPTLLVHGELDPLVDIRDLDYLHSQLPKSKLVVLEGTGHLPAMTRPEDVASEINAFFGV
ncbi:MAG: alpha/beta hydrolase, partial [Alphaproteobacteria bacterium]|nr:alpha/beta hydrolase [Alphaproteobacteria bacterium]